MFVQRALGTRRRCTDVMQRATQGMDLNIGGAAFDAHRALTASPGGCRRR